MTIDESVKFINFDDFYKRARLIKNKYSLFDTEKKMVYKWYVYSNRLIKDYLVDKMWEYLNEPFGSCYYVSYEMLGAYVSQKEMLN